MKKKTGQASLIVTDKLKLFRSPDYNFNFDLLTGAFMRWGRTEADDPEWSPYGPEIMDIEISSGAGCPMSCPFCYKGNQKGSAPTNMSLVTFQRIFATFPKQLTQIAFGITSVNSHPKLFEIFEHCRKNRVIPNVTINGMDPLSDEQVKRLVELCGAVAISVVPPHFDEGYNLIDRLSKAGLLQINVHFMLSKQSLDNAYKVIEDMANDPRLRGLNAIVFLGLKPKERGQAFDVLPVEDFMKLVDHCLEHQVRFGFDSCSSPRFEKAVEANDKLDDKTKKELLVRAERCESGLFSAYLDCHGRYWHCSFGENRSEAYGIDVTRVKNFVNEVWLSEPMKQWRKTLFDLKRECPLYPEIRVSPASDQSVVA